MAMEDEPEADGTPSEEALLAQLADMRAIVRSTQNWTDDQLDTFLDTDPFTRGGEFLGFPEGDGNDAEGQSEESETEASTEQTQAEVSSPPARRNYRVPNPGASSKPTEKSSQDIMNESKSGKDWMNNREALYAALEREEATNG